MFIGSPKQLLITLINTISKVSNHLLISTYPTKKLNKLLTLQFLSFVILSAFLGACGNEQNKSIPENTNDTQKKSSEMPGNPKPIDDSDAPRIIFFGNSLSAGYGLDDPENQSFPGIIRKKIEENNLDYTVVNAGLSGETTAGGKNRIDWILKQPVDIFILELGGNDGLRGIDTEESKRNLQAIIDIVNTKYPEVTIILAGMEAPPNMGDDYTADFRSIYPELAEKNNIALIPFLLQDVGGEAHLNQSDGIHPNIKGHKIVAENVWVILKDFILPEKEDI
ncbi:MAG: arylesterase [Thalassobius sp.]|nr:arylesterase [Thalassovita sp.]